MIDSSHIAMKWGNLAFKFFNSAEALASLINESGNVHILIEDVTDQIDKSISIENYNQKTKFSDHNLAEPVIYNFYHGIELLMKGAIFSKGSTIKKGHDLKKIFEEFKKIRSNEEILLKVLNKHIDTSQMEELNPIRKFCERNSIDTSSFFMALRYPESLKNKDFIHFDLKYNSEDGANYFKKMSEDIAIMKKHYGILFQNI